MYIILKKWFLPLYLIYGWVCKFTFFVSSLEGHFPMYCPEWSRFKIISRGDKITRVFAKRDKNLLKIASNACHDLEKDHPLNNKCKEKMFQYLFLSILNYKENHQWFYLAINGTFGGTLAHSVIRWQPGFSLLANTDTVSCYKLNYWRGDCTLYFINASNLDHFSDSR